MTDIVEYVEQKFRSGNSVPIDRAWISADEWAQLRAEIGRLRGEVEFHQLDAGALRVQLDSCIERLEVQTKNALHLHAMMVDAENRAATVAPAEAKAPAPAMPNGVDGLAYAQRLAAAIWSRNYREVSPQWEVCEDLMGVLSQIDNMVSGMSAADNRDAAGVTDERGRPMTYWGGTPAAVPAGEAVAARDGWTVIEAALARAVKADPADAPFGTTPAEASVWHAAQASAYQHALEMIERTPQPADGEAGAALYGMFRALVDAGGATTVARHGAMPRPEKLMDALTRGMLAIERMFHPERFELDEFPRTAARPPAPVQAAPQEGECAWDYDEDTDAWNGTCGSMWQFTAGDPDDNDMHYCPKCGKRCALQHRGDSRGGEAS